MYFVDKLLLNYRFLKQSPAAHWVHLQQDGTPANSAQRTERTAGQLSKFYHKGPVASKFAEYKPNRLSRGVQCWRLTLSLKQS